MQDTRKPSSQLISQSNSWLRASLIVLLLLAFGLRLTALAQQNIWWDEARNLDVALRPLTQIASAPELDIQPPLYYYALHGWLRLQQVGDDSAPALLAWLARWLSVGAGVVLVAVVAALARRIGGPIAAVGAATLGALSPFWLAESQETRMYTLGLALLSAAAWALLEAIKRTDDDARTISSRSTLPLWIVFVLCSGSAFLVHYNAVFVLVTWYLWWGVRALLQRDRWRALRAPLLCGVATLLLVAPIIPIALRQIPDYANPNLTVPSVLEYVQANVQGHLAGYTWEAAALAGYANWWLWGSFALLGVGLILLLWQRTRATQDVTAARFAREFSFLLVWLIGASILYYIAVLDRGAFNIRYSAFITPALVALAGAAIAGWQQRRLGVPVLLIIALGMLPFVRSDLTDARFFREDIVGVSAWLRANTGAEDVILVDQKYPFGFYYDRYSISQDETPTGDEPAPARYLFVDINTLDQQLDAWAANAQRVFWVQWFESDTDPRHAVPFLLNQNGEHAGDQWFQGWSIDWWQMQPPNDFALAQGLTPQTVRFAAAVQTVEIAILTQMANDAPLPVTIRWQRVGGGTVDRALKARVAIYDENDNRVAQADERLLNDRHLAPAEWATTDQPLNVYLLQSDTPLAPGTYALRLLVYDAETLEPFEVIDVAGNPAGIEAALGQVTVTAAE